MTGWGGGGAVNWHIHTQGAVHFSLYSEHTSCIMTRIVLTGTVICFMYRRPILCTLYGAVDFLNVLKKYIMSL
jgi:hypothetical protein